MIRSVSRFFLFLFAALMAGASTQAADNVILVYDGFYRNIEGSAPFPSATTNYVYNVSVTPYRESDYGAPGFALALPLQVISLTRPAGVSEASALSFVTLSTYSLPLPLSGAPQSFSISIHVPAGFSAGDYSYQIKTLNLSLPTGFSLVDEGTFINMQIRPAAGSNGPPSVSISSPLDQQTFTYTPANGPLLLPFAFTAASTGTSPILTVDADLNNTTVAVTATGINTTSAAGSGTLSITSGGLYTLRARASNGTQTASDSVEFNVVVAAPPPTITAAQPSNNAVYTYTTGGAAVQVPVNFTARSTYGNISAISATLNGSPISNLSAAGLNSLQATGTATLSISTPGTYTLVYTGTNPIGSATTTLSFTVNSVAPTPVVTISQPTAGTTISRVAGSAATVVPFAFQATTPAGTIQAVSVTLNGNPITATAGGLNTGTATGSGSFSVTTPGTYTMVATGSNGSAVASATRTFTVTETTPPPVTTSLIWLPPITNGVTITGGEVMPVRFSVSRNAVLVSDTTVVVAIYEVFANGTSGSPRYYTHGAYSITSNVYNLNFTTAAGAHRYKVEVYTSSTSSAQLLGTKEITTKAATPPDDDCDDDRDHDRDCDRDHDRNRSCNHDGDRDDDDRDHDHDRNCDHNHDRNRSCNNNGDRDDDDRDHDHDRNCDHNHDRNRSCNNNGDRDNDRDRYSDRDRDDDRKKDEDKKKEDDRKAKEEQERKKAEEKKREDDKKKDSDKKKDDKSKKRG